MAPPLFTIKFGFVVWRGLVVYLVIILVTQKSPPRELAIWLGVLGVLGVDTTGSPPNPPPHPPVAPLYGAEASPDHSRPHSHEPEDRTSG
jgi:hypothetical protein